MRTQDDFLKEVKEVAKNSIPVDGNNIGAVLFCRNGKRYFGFTIKRSTVLNSTCAERMALDNWFQDKKRTKPIKLILIGLIKRPGWNNNHVCLPCGVCRELYHQFLWENKIKNFVFECYSWNKKNKFVKRIKDLLFYDKPFYE